ncbi:S-layer homology domain-containing protein [Paenibacillus sp. FSL K6-2524]|uniref:S-layer homology domain-containing protein n=1 Tax=Paenibacillus sp. FSL K6-2524 TaxID=2954516 RepID=UPI0030F6D486
MNKIMLFTINRTKWLTVALVSLLLLTICSPFSVTAESPQPQVSQAGSTNPAQPMNQQAYSDVPVTAWYAEAVNTWIMLGILNPKQGDKLSPQLNMTRGDFAKFLAISLDLSPSKSASTFKDMPVDGELTGYVAALHDAGLAKGYQDGTFRPNLKITRAEVASLIVTAKKLKPEPQVGSGFRDVPQKSWYAGAIGALTKAGIASGKSKVNFTPNANIVLAEGITLLYRSFYTPSIIQDIGNDGTIKIDGKNYRAGTSVQGIFQASNKAALHNAAIKFTYSGDMIKSVEGLIIGYKDSLTETNAPIIFDAKGNTVNGTVIVNSNQVALAHLEVKEDLNLTPAVQSDFFAYNVLIQGKTVFLKDNGRPKSQITNIWFEHSDLGQLYLFNSTLLKKVDDSADKISQSGFKSKGEVSSLENNIYLKKVGIRADLPSPSDFKSKGEVRISAATSTTEDIQQLYVAYFNRPADSAGLQFWQGTIDADKGTVVVTGSFAGMPEYEAKFSGTSNSQIVDQIYLNLFGRPADSTSLAFWAGSIDAAATGINSGIAVNSGADLGPLQLTFENINATVTAAANTELSADTSSTLNTLTLQPGVSVQSSSQTPIDTLIIGNSDTVGPTSAGSTSFTGSANIGQTIVTGNAGNVNLNVQGTIGSLQITGNNPRLDLGDATSIANLIVPSGVTPASFFVNGNDFSRVKAVNGQSTAPIPTPNTNSSPSQGPNPSPSPSQGPNPSPSPSQGPNPSPSPSQGPNPSPSPSQGPNPTPSPSQGPNPTPSPSQEPNPTPSPSQGPNPNPSPSQGPNPSAGT